MSTSERDVARPRVPAKPAGVSMRELLAASAAAHAVSTPPRAPAPQAPAPEERHPEAA
ncbi:hypothetical protein [Streptomyces montanus]|uniref:hypothetical protein n=1 Tax=Streptomyces montanus TaxID=2580423 RepID=UPI00148709CE|nr:hypothetical protein [Streptomyces montanus]